MTIRPALSLTLLVLALVTGCKSEPTSGGAAPSASSASAPKLDERFEPLVGAFNGAADRVRVLALLSPT
jgi:hypothetical protein